MKYCFLFFVLFSFSKICSAQVVVDGKNVNEDKDVEYLQFSFYYEGKQLSPVYLIDYGTVLRDDQQIIPQKIMIDKEEVTPRMTPVYIFNKLYKAGWEYMGDAIFMKAPLIENSQVYTFRRRKK